MKALLLIMLATFSIASTQYKTPVFVVENSTLYCFNHKTELIEEFIPGDLVSGEYASYACSYNKETVQKKYDANIKRKEQAVKTDNSFGLGSWMLAIVFAVLIFICLPRENEED